MSPSKVAHGVYGAGNRSCTFNDALTQFADVIWRIFVPIFSIGRVNQTKKKRKQKKETTCTAGIRKYTQMNPRKEKIKQMNIVQKDNSNSNNGKNTMVYGHTEEPQLLNDKDNDVDVVLGNDIGDTVNDRKEEVEVEAWHQKESRNLPEDDDHDDCVPPKPLQSPLTSRSKSSSLALDAVLESREEGETNMVFVEVPFGKPIEEVYDGVQDGPVLGSGISGLVRKVTHKKTGAEYACKCLDLNNIESAEQLEQLREEIVILCQLDHPHIVRLEEVYESHAEIYLVQELCLGGELFDRLDEQPDYHYTEGECARLVHQMLSAVRYLHSKGITHRDLKLENFLFSTERQSQLKMIDFGISKHFLQGERLSEGVGTPYTIAPEVILGDYDAKCDMWAIGVIAYLLLSGDAPFGGVGAPGETMQKVRENILGGQFRFEPEYIWETVSPAAKDFICDVLVTDPTQRPSAQQAQKHPWIQQWKKKKYGKLNGTNGGTNNALNPQVVQALVSFKEFSDLHKLLCEVLSFTLLPDQIWDLRFEFAKIDTEGTGEISLQSLKQVLLANANAGSLGALTEEEVEDIFHAMQIRSSRLTIKWHEFIAAGLSQCRVDERNLRLAFDRLDADHKGYITFDNLMDLLGGTTTNGTNGTPNDTNGGRSKSPRKIKSHDDMHKMWTDSINSVNNCGQARITYNEFVLLMKGQTTLQDVEPEPETTTETTTEVVATVQEDAEMSMSDIASAAMAAATSSTTAGTTQDGSPLDTDDFLRMSTMMPPKGHRRTHSSDNPYLPHGGGGVARRRRTRSNSYTTQQQQQRRRCDTDNRVLAQFAVDARRAMLLPEHDQKDEIHQLIQEEKPLEVNRQLYRAHRQMRLSILEASKRFEEKQRARAESKQQQPQPLVETTVAEHPDEQTGTTTTTNKAEAAVPTLTHTLSHDEGTVVQRPGLVMRHGQQQQPQEQSESVRAWIERNQEEQTALVEKATRQGSLLASTPFSHHHQQQQQRKKKLMGHQRSASDFLRQGGGLDLSDVFAQSMTDFH